MKHVLLVITLLTGCIQVQASPDSYYSEFKKAAEQGNAAAQYYIGIMYDQGNGVTQDYRQAAEWYRKAAEQGHTRAQYYIGNMYAQGQGVVQNHKQSAEWYRKAAKQGHATAQYNLGIMYDQGQGVIQDYRQAVEWYRKAAEQGKATAQTSLRVMYSQGLGVIQSNEKAYIWSSLAGTQGHAGATNNRDIYARRLTKKGLDRAQAKASELYEQIAKRSPCRLGGRYILRHHIRYNYHAIRHPANHNDPVLLSVLLSR